MTLTSPGQAILWQIAWRARWGLLPALVYLLTAIVLSHVLPQNLSIQLGGDSVPAVGWFLGMPGLFTNILLVAAFTMAGTDVADTGFTKHMFVLPVRTRTLVAWPMFSGCVAVAGLWLITATLIFRPGGIAAPLWWPAAAMIYFLTVFQAVCWTPFVQRWLHLAVIVLALMLPMIALPFIVLLDLQWSEPVVAALLLAIVPVAYLAALSGVARTRRGEPYEWRLWSRLAAWATTRRLRIRPPFSSPQAAQLWFDCRAQVWTVPMFLGFMLLCGWFIPFLDRDDAALSWRFLGILAVLPLLIGTMTGGVLGNLHDPFSKSDTANFLLARPISTAALVRTKLLAAAICTAAIWALTLAFISLLLLRPGFCASLLALAREHPAWKAVGLPLLLLVLLVLLTWKTICENLWIVMTGRNWVAGAFNTIVIALIFCGGGLGLWICFHPQVQPAARAAVPWLTALLLLVKAGVAIAVGRGLLRGRLMSPPAIAAALGTWAIVVTGLSGLALWLIPGARVATFDIISGVALWIPFSRLAGATLALDWNRHR